MSANNRISNLVNTQLPFFVRNDHRTFVAFIEAYYEYLEQTVDSEITGKTLERMENMRNYYDIDTTIDAFANKLYSEYLHGFPDNTLADKDMILKNAKDFYRSKGSEKSLRFLLRAMFGEEAEVYYPKKDVLRASDGKWYIQKSLRVTDTTIDGTANSNLSGLEKYVGRSITGNTSNATATVETIDRFFESGTRIDELVLSSIVGSFTNGETVCAMFDELGETRQICSNVFGGIINSITIVDPGARYNIGDPIVIESSSGSGGAAVVARVSTGNISSITVLNGGAGYQNGNWLLITGGGGGSGANGNVSVLADETYHPNSYNIISDIISLEADTPLNNTVFSNLGPGTANVNTALGTALASFVYANTGPARAVLMINSGSDYTTEPSISVLANTRIRELGILGRMEIANGGVSYAVSDKIEFQNVLGGYGSGASGNVTAVDGSGTITSVEFEAVPGQITGGSGYDQSHLPLANVVSGTGSGANVRVTALLGYGGEFISANTTLGAIERITITSGGSGYTEAPTLNLTSTGDGTAQATATIVAGVYEYPGRWLNDDGHLSSYNFLQDRDYYQDYSYVVRIRKSIELYRKVLKDLVHPAGTKMFGSHIYIHDGLDTTNSVMTLDTTRLKFRDGTYTSNNGNVEIRLANSNVSVSDSVYLKFKTGNTTANVFLTSNVSNGQYLPLTANISNGIFEVSLVNSTVSFFVTHYTSVANTSGNVSVGVSVT